MMIEDAIKMILNLRDGEAKTVLSELGIKWETGRRWLHFMQKANMVELEYKRGQKGYPRLFIKKKYVIGMIPESEQK